MSEATLTRRLQRVLRSGGVGRHAMVLAGGATVAQLLAAAAFPLLTRLYGPPELGQFGLVMAFLHLAAVGLTLRLEMAVVSAPSDPEAARVASAAIVIVPIAATASAAIFFLLIVASIGRYGELAPAWALLVPIPLIAMGLLAVLRSWMVRRQAFAPLSQIAMIQSGVRAGTQVTMGFLGVGSLGLVLGDLIGRAAGVSRLALRELPAIAAAGGGISGGGALDVLRRYWKYPVYSLPSSFLNALPHALVVPIVGQFYGIGLAGQYVLVGTVFAVPLAIVGASVADAFHGRIAELARVSPAAAMGFFVRTVGALALAGIVMGTAVFLGAPTVFPWLFGDEWQTAGYVAAVTAPRMVMHLIVSPVSRVIYVYGGQEAKLLFDSLLLIAIVGSLLTGYLLHLSFIAALAVLTAADVFTYAVYGGILWRLVHRSSPQPAES